MIKINSLLSRGLFSTLVFPEHYQEAFRINHEIRGCLTLAELSEYVVGNDELIRKHAKTSILEYLNEIPLHFNMKSISTPLQVYFYVLTLQDLNLYEEQLRLSNLIKLSVYAGQDALKLKDLMDQQQRRLETITQKQPFDVVDAINWLVLKGESKGSRLGTHALEVLSRSPLDQFAIHFSRLVNMILKSRPWNMQPSRSRSGTKSESTGTSWSSWGTATRSAAKATTSPSRSPTPKYLFLTQRLAHLQMHKLGYDAVPRSIIQLLARADQFVGRLGLRHCETVFQLLSLLPHNACSHQQLEALHQKVLKEGGTLPIFLQLMPFDRMTKEQAEALIRLYADRWIGLGNGAYFLNRPELGLLCHHPYFMEKYYKLFVHGLDLRGQSLITIFGGVVAAAAKLLHFFGFDPLKKSAIGRQFTKFYRESVAEMGEGSLLSGTSLCNIFHLRLFHKEFAISENHGRFLQLLEAEVENFTRRKVLGKTKRLRSNARLEEVVQQYRDSEHKELLEMIKTVVTASLNYSQHCELSLCAWLLFSLEGSSNSHFFKGELNKLYGRFGRNDTLALTEYYLLFPHQTQPLTIRMLAKLWDRSKSLAVVSKVIAHADLVCFQQSGGLEDTVGLLLREVASHAGKGLKGKPGLEELSMGELTALLRFCTCFYEQTMDFAKHLFFETIHRIETAEKYDTLIKHQTAAKESRFLSALCSLASRVMP
jgi:hypothetical protein